MSKHINPAVWEDKKHWIKPETKSQSKTNSGSRRSERGRKGVYVHNLGSISLSSPELQLVSFKILIQINSLISIVFRLQQTMVTHQQFWAVEVCPHQQTDWWNSGNSYEGGHPAGPFSSRQIHFDTWLCPKMDLLLLPTA